MFRFNTAVDLKFFAIKVLLIINDAHANYLYLFLDELIGLLMSLILCVFVIIIVRININMEVMIYAVSLLNECCFIFRGEKMMGLEEYEESLFDLYIYIFEISYDDNLGIKDFMNENINIM
jgi:hypothetical protein